MENSENMRQTFEAQIGSAADDRELWERVARIEESIQMRERGQRQCGNGAAGTETLRHPVQKNQAKKGSAKKRGGMKLLEGLFRLIREAE